MSKFKCQNSKFKINPNVKTQIPKLGFFHLSFVFCHSFVICALSFVILTYGCATIKEAAKGIAGISTKEIEEARGQAIKKTFDYDYKACYDKIMNILRKTGAYIYAKDEKKNMIAIYVSETDTTSVGIFLESIGANNTQIEVSSASTYAKELISARLFEGLKAETDTIYPVTE